jgi:toxin-antitoxin system PIN domain toxin
VILLDANLLLYAYNSTFEQHKRAKAWLERALSEPAPVGLPWTTILAFLRVGTNPRAFPNPLGPDEATTIVSSWLAHPMVVIAEPGGRHWEILSSLLRSTQSRGPRVMDAHLAALAIEYGATLCTTDNDFKLFPGLQLQNPLETS